MLPKMYNITPNNMERTNIKGIEKPSSLGVRLPPSGSVRLYIT